MEITKDNLQEVIYALRKCAKEHEHECVPTGAIVTASHCYDVAAYLELLQTIKTD